MSQQPWSFEASVPRGSLLPSAGVGMKTGSMGKIPHPSFEQTKWAEEWLCDATYSIIFRCMENQIVLPYKREMWWNVCVFVRLSLMALPGVTSYWWHQRVDLVAVCLGRQQTGMTIAEVKDPNLFKSSTWQGSGQSLWFLIARMQTNVPSMLFFLQIAESLIMASTSAILSKHHGIGVRLIYCFPLYI